MTIRVILMSLCLNLPPHPLLQTLKSPPILLMMKMKTGYVVSACPMTGKLSSTVATLFVGSAPRLARHVHSVGKTSPQESECSFDCSACCALVCHSKNKTKNFPISNNICDRIRFQLSGITLVKFSS